jgi:hypothetical protein
LNGENGGSVDEIGVSGNGDATLIRLPHIPCCSNADTAASGRAAAAL